MTKSLKITTSRPKFSSVIKTVLNIRFLEIPVTTVQVNPRT